MRILSIIPMLAATMSMQARDMFVVVHTRDAKVEVYVCEENETLAPGVDALTRTVVRDRGYFRWHVVGGVEPYTVIEVDRPGSGAVCVTVIDALGQVATGCGVIQTFVDVRTVPCPQFNESVEPATAPVAEPGDRTMKPAPPTPKPERPTPRIGPSDPQVRGGGGGGGNGGLVRGYSHRGAGVEGGGGGLTGGQRTRNTGSGTGGSGGTIPRQTTPGVR